MSSNGSNPEDRPRTEWEDPQLLGTGFDPELGTEWRLDFRQGRSGNREIAGLFVSTPTGRGGGGGSLGGLSTMQCRMTALDPGTVTIYGPLRKSLAARTMTVEFADGNAKPGAVLRGPDSLEFDFFISVVNRRPTRLLFDTADDEAFVIPGLDIKARDFEYELDG